MRLLVIGGNGFLGSHFVAAAVDAGHDVTVAGLHQREPSFAHQRSFSFLSGGIDALGKDSSDLSKADVVLHFATSSKPASADEDPQRHRDEAEAQISSLLQAMQAVGPERLVFVSSGGAVYGAPTVVPIPENHPLHPIGVYGEIKRMIENRISEHTKHFNLKPLIVRPSNPYGPGQRAGAGFAVIPTFINAVQNDRPVILFGDGTAQRDYVHVADVAQFILTALEERHYGAFNVGSGQGTSLLELLALIERVTGKAALREMRPVRIYDPQRIILDVSKAWQIVGWQPTISLEQGIAQYVEMMR